MTETTQTVSTQQYVTGNIYLAAALLCVDSNYKFGGINFDEKLQYNKAKFVIEYPEEMRKKFLDIISDFDQKSLIVNLYKYNYSLRKIREALSNHQEEAKK